MPIILSSQAKSKFHNIKTEYNGIIYHSKSESDYAKTLDLLKYAGEIITYDRQVPYIIRVNGILICRYILDFAVEYPTHTELVEVKGYETAVWKLKKKLLEATVLQEQPNLVYVVIDKKGAIKYRSQSKASS